MKRLEFPAQSYSLDKDTFTYNKTEDSLIGLLELLWTAIVNSPYQDLDKKEHRVNKRLKSKLKEITQWRDKDKDSRITLDGEQNLLVEEDEFDLLKKLLEANKFASRVSEDVSALWDIIDGAKEYKVELVKEG